jgi:hypothetical protein
MFKKILLIILVMILSLSSIVSAFTAYVYPAGTDTDKIYYDEVAQYNVTISNSLERDAVFSIVISPVDWIIESNVNVLVKANSTQIFPLSIKPNPTNFKSPGNYYIPAIIKSNDEFINSNIKLFIKSFKDGYGEYNPAVSMTVIMNGQTDPREKLSTQILFKNRNILDLKGLKIHIYSPGICDEIQELDLDSLSEKTLQYKINLNPLTKPGMYPITFTTSYDNKTLSQGEYQVEILPYSVIDREKSEYSKWFKKTMITTLVNNGNVPKDVKLGLETPWYKRIVSKVNIEAQKYESTSSDWVITLNPEETAVVRIEENNRWYWYGLFILLLIIIIYFSFRSPIMLEKQIIVTGKDEEGTSEMKVRIFAKNRTSKPYFNLRLIDIAPSIATVVEEEYFGVVKPTKVIPTDKKGTIVKWDIDSLEAYEERIFSYSLKARLKIIGNLNLPAVKAKFEDSKGVERAISSKKGEIGTKK